MLCADVTELEAYLDALGRHLRAAVCPDTCHVFAAGHDLSADGGPAAMLDALAAAAGPGRLKLVHVVETPGGQEAHARGIAALKALRDGED